MAQRSDGLMVGTGRAAGLLAVALLLATALPGIAGADDERARAKQLKDEGAEAMQRGDVARALDRFREAYRISSSPNMLFNIALALDRLERAGEALEVFESFLSSVPDAPGSARAHATERAAELSRRVGHLAISADVDGAVVTVDGRAAGATPMQRAIHVDPGSHRIAAERAGYRAAATSVIAQAGQTVPIVLHLEPEVVAPAAPAPVAVVTPATPLALPAPAPPRRPIYRRWWFWTVVTGAALAAGGLALGLTLGSTTHTPEPSLGHATGPAAP